ncbi:hypothetical protein [Vibrio mediterranei]|uniref:hypothetical protein n=1 Tax=Vibrio mediterranei TaxID=689 RepID=UPI00228401FF|nr:hypothetical protein [Vibrio mediterranei]MCY9855143.1 hypothetical protein [Vibrio mediterranei]
MKIRKMNSADLTALYDVYTDKEVVNNNRYVADIKRDEFDSMFNDNQHNFVAVESDGKLLGHLAINTTENQGFSILRLLVSL